MRLLGGTRGTVVPRSPLERCAWRAAAAPIVWALLLATPAALAACPFCTAVAPTLSQTRETAAIVALVEPLPAEAAAAGSSSAPRGRRAFQVHRVLKGKLPGDPPVLSLPAPVLSLPAEVSAPARGLALAFCTAGAAGQGDAGAPVSDAWMLLPVSELGYAYFAHAPDLRTENSQRLGYFARYLEHADPLVAEDAYLEFGHAPYDEVAKVADRLPMERLRAWVADPQVPERRKGFYGLALGLATDAGERQRNRRLLEELIAAPPASQRAGADFRSGFDGLLGGYLMLAGRDGLEKLVTRYFANPDAAEGDLRHAVTALRFYHEYGREIPLADQQAALRHVLGRAQLADQAVIDLARWGDWDALAQVAALYDRAGAGTAALRRAVVGYLLACPRADAATALNQLRTIDPQGVADAEQVLRELHGAPRAAAANEAR